ncbi:MAG: hypothetical protein LBS55_02320 [Prevotellaceae bacterium]|jgi:hypothetical protein|nr:hypothetical protein [Prevotellaceae bacterium]
MNSFVLHCWLKNLGNIFQVNIFLPEMLDNSIIILEREKERSNQRVTSSCTFRNSIFVVCGHCYSINDKSKKFHRKYIFGTTGELFRSMERCLHDTALECRAMERNTKKCVFRQENAHKHKINIKRNHYYFKYL